MTAVHVVQILGTERIFVLSDGRRVTFDEYAKMINAPVVPLPQAEPEPRPVQNVAAKSVEGKKKWQR